MGVLYVKFKILERIFWFKWKLWNDMIWIVDIIEFRVNGM